MDHPTAKLRHGRLVEADYRSCLWWGPWSPKPKDHYDLSALWDNIQSNMNLMLHIHVHVSLHVCIQRRIRVCMCAFMCLCSAQVYLYIDIQDIHLQSTIVYMTSAQGTALNSLHWLVQTGLYIVVILFQPSPWRLSERNHTAPAMQSGCQPLIRLFEGTIGCWRTFGLPNVDKCYKANIFLSNGWLSRFKFWGQIQTATIII